MGCVLILFAVLSPSVDTPTAEDMHAESTRIRVARGLKPQSLDTDCCSIAQRWAEYMAKNKTMRHGGGEQIIARGYKTVDAVFRAWMNSSGHRHWVLSRRSRAGWGLAQSSSGLWYWAGAFRHEKKPVNPPQPFEEHSEPQARVTLQQNRCVLWRREDYV